MLHGPFIASQPACNNSVSGIEQAKVVQEASKGQFRLLYLSPERLARKRVWLFGEAGDLFHIACWVESRLNVVNVAERSQIIPLVSQPESLPNTIRADSQHR